MNIRSVKSLIAVAALLAAVSTSLGQGQIKGTSFNQTDSSLGKIFNTDGTTGLNGTGFSVELWGGTGTDTTAFTLIRPATSISLVNGRTFDTGSSTLSGTTGSFNYQYRAWDNQSGTVTSFSSATLRGASALATVTLTVSPAQPVEAQNFLNFQLSTVAVPEPTTILLGLAGGATLLLRRRKD